MTANDTTARMVSPVFAGRETELTVLADCYAAVCGGAPATVLLGGEAGVGKTRLVTEFVARVHEAARVLVGGCLELSSAGLPYAPFAAVLRGLAEDPGTDAISALLPGGIGELAVLLPELGASAAVPETGRSSLFGRVRALLERLAEREPLILVVEDAHWADRSTRDLLGYLVRELRHGPILLLITFRSDDLHRTHPLRPMLAELARLDGVVRLEPARLERGEVAAQLDGILGRPADPLLVEGVYGRSGGVPLFVEATAACPARHGRSEPGSAGDLLLAGVHRLPEDTQELLRTASAGGVRIGHELLAVVSGLDERALTAALRPAIDAGILVPDAGGHRFRHALIREAIHEDLLPGDRSRTHRRFAEVIEAAPEIGQGCDPAVTLARHWYAAHDHARALLAAWRAAAALATALAYAEQLEMLGRVLELWDRVPDAAELVGSDQVGVLLLAVEAAHSCGESGFGLAMIRAALAELDGRHDPERAALLLTWRAVFLAEPQGGSAVRGLL
jgi:predicted ATPase